MSGRQLDESEKRLIYTWKVAGLSLAEIATRLTVVPATARKWWRWQRDHGQGAPAPRPGRPQEGCLSSFSEPVRSHALALKREHPLWGADYVLAQLTAEQASNPAWVSERLPGRSQLTQFFRQVCPEAVQVHPSRPAPTVQAAPPQATAVHEVWAMDVQENIRLQDGQIVSICTVRDVYSAAVLASQAFLVTTARAWRKLTLDEVRQVLRQAFREWHTLPVAIQTDNELCLAGSPTGDYPPQLTLWLMGLGIEHRRSRPARPTDNPEIERTHRSLHGFAVGPESCATLATLQQSLDEARACYNHYFKARTKHCDGEAPLRAHPALLTPVRPFDPAQELARFSRATVVAHLATYRFQRKITVSGQAYLGSAVYGIGTAYKQTATLVYLDPEAEEWLFTCPLTGMLWARCTAQHLDLAWLTGLPLTSAPSDH